MTKTTLRVGEDQIIVVLEAPFICMYLDTDDGYSPMPSVMVTADEAVTLAETLAAAAARIICDGGPLDPNQETLFG